MKKPSKRRTLAQSLSALMVASALVAPAPAVLAADAAAPATTKDGKKAANPCGPDNPCGPAKKKKKSSGDNPCAPSNPCAPKK